MKIILFIVITIIIFFSWFFLDTTSSSNSLETTENAYISKEEASSKITDLTSLSSRISKKNMYICVESYRNELEKQNLLYWQVTCESFYNENEWLWWEYEFCLHKIPRILSRIASLDTHK